jgi:amino acid transporter
VGLGLTGILYALLMLTCFATVPDLAGDSRPLATAAAALIGPVGTTLVALTAVVSCAGGLSVNLMVTPRVLHALAVQGDLPRPLAGLSPVRLVPAAAIVTVSLIVWLLTISGTFVYLATIAVMARLLLYVATCAALIRLRIRDGAAPLTLPGGPALAVAAIGCCLAVLATTTGAALRDLAIALLAGLLLRAGVRWRARRRG